MKVMVWLNIFVIKLLKIVTWRDVLYVWQCRVLFCLFTHWGVDARAWLWS